eukprot:15474525-Alexandrium_andersonii.AAC.1
MPRVLAGRSRADPGALHPAGVPAELGRRRFARDTRPMTTRLRQPGAEAQVSREKHWFRSTRSPWCSAPSTDSVR